MIRVHELTGKTLSGAEGIPALEAALRPTPAWVHVVSPTPEELAALRERLGLHELALEDAVTSGHPPKFEEFDDHAFVIAHTPTREPDRSTRKVSVFLAKGWVVTMLRAPLPEFDALEQRLERDPGALLKSADRFAITVLDVLTDGFETETEELLERVEALEVRAIADAGTETLTAILTLRGDLVDLNRIVRAQRDVYGQVLRTALPVVTKRALPYMRDVYDHIVRVRDLLESARDNVAAARDAYLAAASNRMNETMRALTVIATTMLPLSLVTGFFGMNFIDMPGTRHPAAFWITLAAMGTLATLMLVWFRRRGWV